MRPSFLEKFERYGVALDTGMFAAKPEPVRRGSGRDRPPHPAMRRAALILAAVARSPLVPAQAPGGHLTVLSTRDRFPARLRTW